MSIHSFQVPPSRNVVKSRRTICTYELQHRPRWLLLSRAIQENHRIPHWQKQIAILADIVNGLIGLVGKPLRHHDPVQRPLKSAISPPLQNIGPTDDQVRGFLVANGDEMPGCRLSILVFESAFVILNIEADEAEVSVRPNASGVGLRELPFRETGVMVQA